MGQTPILEHLHIIWFKLNSLIVIFQSLGILALMGKSQPQVVEHFSLRRIQLDSLFKVINGPIGIILINVSQTAFVEADRLVGIELN